MVVLNIIGYGIDYLYTPTSFTSTYQGDRMLGVNDAMELVLVDSEGAVSCV